MQVYSSVRVDVFKFQPVIVKVCWLCRCLLECFPDRLRDTHPWPDFLLICLPAFGGGHFQNRSPVVSIFGVGHFKNHSLVISPIVLCRWRTWRAVTQNHPWDHVWEVSLTQLLYTTTIVFFFIDQVCAFVINIARVFVYFAWFVDVYCPFFWVREHSSSSLVGVLMSEWTFTKWRFVHAPPISFAIAAKAPRPDPGSAVWPSWSPALWASNYCEEAFWTHLL